MNNFRRYPIESMVKLCNAYYEEQNTLRTIDEALVLKNSKTISEKYYGVYTILYENNFSNFLQELNTTPLTESNIMILHELYKYIKGVKDIDMFVTMVNSAKVSKEQDYVKKVKVTKDAEYILENNNILISNLLIDVGVDIVFKFIILILNDL